MPALVPAGQPTLRAACPALPWPVAANCQRQRPRAASVCQRQTAGPATSTAARRRAVCSAEANGSSGGSGATSVADNEQAAAAAPTPSAYTAAALAKFRFTSPDGRWVVRPLDKSNLVEVRRIVALQTDAFHTAGPLPFLDGVSKRFFEAEVLSEMQKKLKFNPDDMFISLVIEPADAAAVAGAGPSSSTGSSTGSSSAATCNIIGVVEVSYVGPKDVLRLLEPGTTAFCYVASMVVAPAWRRRGAASTLLAAAEAASAAWDEQQALLHVYQDNTPAVQLYESAGYEIIWRQNTAWAAVGTRPRYLMRKRW